MAAIAVQVALAKQSLQTTAEVQPARITSPGYIEADYNGQLLSQTRNLNATAAFDPAFNAGVAAATNPTSTGRLASWVLRHGNDESESSDFRPTFLVIAAAVPAFLSFAAFVVRSSMAAIAITPWLAVAAWWLRPNQHLIIAGHNELTLLGPLLTAYLTSLYGFHRQPGLITWLGLIATSAIGWSVVPMPWTMASTLGAICWLLVAYRHDAVWNGLAVLSFLIGLSPVAPPFVETMAHPDVFAHLTPGGLSDWLTPTSRMAMPLDSSVFVPVAAGLTIGLLRRLLFRTARFNAGEWLIGCAVAGLGAGFILHHNGFVASATLDVLGLLAVYLLLPSVAVWLTPQSARFALPVVLVVAGTIGVAACRVPPPDLSGDLRPWAVGRLDVGWSTEDAACRHEWQSTFRSTARVLWERQPHDHFTPTTLPLDFSIPVLTGRDLESDDQPWSFAGGVLGGRNVADWSDNDLQRFCDRWNIGWIRAVNSATRERLGRWNAAKVWNSTSMSTAAMFSIDRPQTYFLKGRGELETASLNQIVLKDVVPEHGEVVLCFCWHPGWTAAPSHVTIESETDAFDPMPLMRLRCGSPITRLVLRWTSQ
ncbi:MAG: hypothetical protein ACJ8C4_16785 [Gemmataceae bacterium]